MGSKKNFFKNHFKKKKFKIDSLDFYLHGKLLIIPFGPINQKL